MEEKEKNALKRCMLLHGYSSCETDYFDSQDYRRLRYTMLDYLPHDENSLKKSKCIFKSEVMQAGRFVIDKHFGMLDLRVPYSKEDDLKSQVIALFGTNPDKQNYDKIIKYINDQANLVRVTDIPVYLDIDSSSNGYVSRNYFLEDEKIEDDFYKKLPIVTTEIGLLGDCNEDKKTTYVHEMVHALLDRNKGSVKNLLNLETLSIFMERVAAQDLDSSNKLLDRNILLRILYTKHNVLNRELLQFENNESGNVLRHNTYIISSLNATALFQTYLKSNKIKKEIDEEIGKVITGDKLLEDMLNHFEAVPERGTKIMSKQIKTFHN